MDNPEPHNNTRAFAALRPPPESMSDGTVTLRRWLPSDADGFCHVINSSRAEFAEWFPWAREPYRHEDACSFMDRKARGWDEGRTWSYAITRAEDTDNVLGSCDIGLWDGNRGLNLGYWLATEYLGRGYATRATAMLVRAAFEDMGTRLVRIVHDAANERSARIPRRLGFECVGEHQPAPGDENPENRPDVSWIKYQGEAGAAIQASGGVMLCSSRVEPPLSGLT